MTQTASFARVVLFAAAAIGLASACGGQSFSDGSNGGDAGKGGGGSTSHAGTTGNAGVSGKGHAGSGVGGSNVGGTGAAGAPFSEPCDAPPEPGSCDAYAPSWYHDRSSGICRPFVYGGCGGNKNRYPTLEACNMACPGGNPNYDACNTAADCVVTGTSCCGICDGPNITANDLVAYNKQYAPFLQCSVALTLPPPNYPGSDVAAPVACAPCPPQPGPSTLMYFLPDCVAGQCVVQDIRTAAVTACKTSDECELRRGTGCCPGCPGSTDLVSVRNDGSFEKLACSAGPVPCPSCVNLTPPTGAEPYCDSGHCAVAIPL